MNPAFLAAGLCGMQIGVTLLASEVVVADVGPGRLGFLRYTIAVVFLLPLAMAVKAQQPFARRDLLPVALLGIGQFGVLIALLYVALLYTSSPRAALVFATLPLMTMAVSQLLGQASPGPRGLIAILLTLAGIASLLGLDALAGRLSWSDLIGCTLAALATLTGALCSVFYRPYLERNGVMRTSALAMAASLPPLALLSLLEPATLPISDWTGTIVALVVFVGISSGTGYLAWLYALSRADATRVTAFLSLSPVTAGILSVSLLGEPMTPGLVVGILLVAAGLIVLARDGRKAQAAPSV